MTASVAGTLAAAFLVVLAPSPGWTSTTGQVLWSSFPKIVVIGNGQEYTGVTAPGYAWEGEFEIETGAIGRIKSWEFNPELTIGTQASLSLHLYRASASYPNAEDPWPRPKKVHQTVGRIFPDVAIKAYIVGACNEHAATLRQAGQSNAQIFAQAHVLPATYKMALDFEVTWGETFLAALPPTPAEIVCEKWVGAVKPAPSGMAVKMEVKEAKLLVFPTQHAGGCPVQVGLFMQVTGNGYGSFETWMESTEGWKSKKTQKNIAGKKAGQYVEEFSDKLTVPTVLPTSAPSGGGAGSQAVGGGLTASKPPGDTFPGQGKPPVAPKGGLTTGQAANVHQAALRLIAVPGARRWRRTGRTTR